MLGKYSRNLNEKISYIDLITYFLMNFKSINKVEDLPPELRSKFLEITNTPEQQMIRMMEVSYPGEQGHSFAFQEDGTFGGIFDLDFVNDALANFRAQLFAKGFFATSKINKKYASIMTMIMSKYGKGIDKLQGYDKTWHDEKAGLVITLRKVKETPKPSISFTIVDEKFAQGVLLEIERNA